MIAVATAVAVAIAAAALDLAASVLWCIIIQKSM